MSKKAPKFEESIDSQAQGSNKKKRKSKADNFKFRYKKSFAALMEEEHMLNKEPPNYQSAGVPPSTLPERKFCAVCGYPFTFPSNYTCVQCGARYCCVRCLGTHQDTRYVCA
ncbi:hypothetical protein FSP39_004272 [Pinctada imbricata]|uniref:HIT-type domain-containing protein n=1 Tax=Pinctada imbricata TaxID=66713 RepID=A0AA89BT13_PINIB|nr:hypothetical protein FSP39_004272 [Pinctada imbricata]